MSPEKATQDWSAYEVAETAEVKPVEILHPEAAAEQMVACSLADLDNRLMQYRERVNLTFVPDDDNSVVECALFIDGCKVAADHVEAKRDALVRPLNEKVEEYNKPRIKVREFFKSMAKLVVSRVNERNEKLRVAAELETQRRIKEANAKQALLDRQAQEAKDKAAEAAASGDAVTAAVLEGKASILEQKASEVVPMLAAAPSGKVNVGTATVSFGWAKKVWSLIGWDDKKKPLRVSDPALASLVGDLSKLPEGVRFILQHADLNPIYLNASFKGGMKFPAPFVEVNDYSKSKVR